MKRYGNLFDKICSMENLKEAHKRARKDKLFYDAVKMVDSDPEYYLQQVQDMLVNDTYEVSEYRITILNDHGKERELAKLPYFPDRIIQWAIMLQVEPIFTKTFCYHTFASIKYKGTNSAIKLLKKYLKDVQGTKYCLQLDVKKFYPNVDHDVLKELLRKKFKDTKLLALMDKIIDSNPKEVGIPMGSYLSQFFANFYLSYFDHWLKEDLKIKYAIRYMDDLIILGDNKTSLHRLKTKIEVYLNSKLKLKLKENWQVYPVDDRGIDFVGIRCFHGYSLLRKRIANRMKKRMRRIYEKTQAGIIMSRKDFGCINSYYGWCKRCNGHNLIMKYIAPLGVARMTYFWNKVLAADECNRQRYIKYVDRLTEKGLVTI